MSHHPIAHAAHMIGLPRIREAMRALDKEMREIVSEYSRISKGPLTRQQKVRARKTMSADVRNMKATLKVLAGWLRAGQTKTFSERTK